MELLTAIDIEDGRRDANDNMSDRCRITKAGVGKGPWDEDSMTYDPPARVIVYEGRCRLQIKADINSNVVETTAGEHEWTYLTGTLQVPVDPDPRDTPVGHPGDVRVDHVAEILTAPYDAKLVGRMFNINGMVHKTHSTHRRLRVKETVN